MPDDALPSLIEAKAQSDKKRYDLKHRILANMIRHNPDAFVIDEDDGKGIVGITHVETGFRLHMPRQVIPMPIANIAHTTKSATDLSNTVGYLKRLNS